MGFQLRRIPYLAYQATATMLSHETVEGAVFCGLLILLFKKSAHLHGFFGRVSGKKFHTILEFDRHS